MDNSIVAALIGVGGTIVGAAIPLMSGRRSAVRTKAYDQVTGSITEPSRDAVVDRSIPCEGLVLGMQEGMNLWLAVEVGGLVWPKESKVLPGPAGKWTAVVFEDGASERMALSLFVADAKADRRIREWLDAGRRSGTYTELPGIPGARRLARVDGLQLKKS